MIVTVYLGHICCGYTDRIQFGWRWDRYLPSLQQRRHCRGQLPHFLSQDEKLQLAVAGRWGAGRGKKGDNCRLVQYNPLTRGTATIYLIK